MSSSPLPSPFLTHPTNPLSSSRVDYGVARSISPRDSLQWQLPIGLQILPAALLGLGMLTLKESTRWLMSQNRYDEAWESLTWIRASAGEETHLEMDEIRAGVEYEAHAKRNFQFRELLDPPNFKRVSTAAAVFTAQQATGATAFAYYGPQYFKLLVGSKGTTPLLLTAIFGAVKVLACLLFVLFLADKIGRRQALTLGALFMAACQITTAVVLKYFPPPKKSAAGQEISSAGIGMIALIYLFVIAYNASWGPLPWPYVAEIFPPRIREPGVGIGVAFQWLFNFGTCIPSPSPLSPC